MQNSSAKYKFDHIVVSSTKSTITGNSAKILFLLLLFLSIFLLLQQQRQQMLLLLLLFISLLIFYGCTVYSLRCKISIITGTSTPTISTNVDAMST